MSGTRGFTLIELIIATAIMLAMTAAVMALLHDGLVRTPLLEEGTDLHQRARVVADALAADLRGAGSGTQSGPLSATFAVIEPRAPRAPAGSAASDVVTIRAVPAQAPRSRLAQALEPEAAAALLAPAGCPHHTTACGFETGMRAFVFDARGHVDLIQIAAISPGMLLLAPAGPPRAVTYDAGSEIAAGMEVTYALDGPTRELRRTEGGGTFAIADNVEALTFEYVGPRAHPLPLAIFADGPFRGAGARVFDADALGIRGVRAQVRLGSESGRVPAATVRITVALRNGS